MTVSFYLDVHDVTTASVTNVLKQAAEKDSFPSLKVKFILLKHVVVGELSLISEEREREKENIKGWLLIIKAWLALSIG